MKACFSGLLCKIFSSQDIITKILRNSFTLFFTMSFVSSFVQPSKSMNWILMKVSRSFDLLDLSWMCSVFVTFPVIIYLFEVKNRITRKRFEIYSTLTKKYIFKSFSNGSIIYLFIYLFTYLFVYLFIYLFIYLFFNQTVFKNIRIILSSRPVLELKLTSWYV